MSRPRALGDYELEWLHAALASGMPWKMIAWRLRVGLATIHRSRKYLDERWILFRKRNDIEPANPAAVDPQHAPCGSTRHTHR